MKKSSSIISFVFFLGIIFLPACTGFKNIEISEVQAIRFDHLSKGKLGLEVDLSLKNPNRIDIFLVKSDLQVILNDIPVGTLSNFKKIKIPGGSQNTVTFPVDIKMNGVLKNILAFVSIASGGDVRLKLEGNLKVRFLLISRSVPVTNEVVLKIH